MINNNYNNNNDDKTTKHQTFNTRDKKYTMYVVYLNK